MGFKKNAEGDFEGKLDLTFEFTISLKQGRYSDMPMILRMPGYYDKLN